MKEENNIRVSRRLSVVKEESERRRQIQDAWNNSAREADELDVEHKGETNQGKIYTVSLDYPDGWQC